jgi:hypothetical protein
MINTKETINEEQNTDNHIVIQPKTPTSVSKRKILDIQVSEVKHVKVVEKIDNQKLSCALCNKALKFINTFTCRCEKAFCAKHRFFDQHMCTFDYRSDVRDKLKAVNQKVAPKKISE